MSTILKKTAINLLAYIFMAFACQTLSYLHEIKLMHAISLLQHNNAQDVNAYLTQNGFTLNSLVQFRFNTVGTWLIAGGILAIATIISFFVKNGNWKVQLSTLVIFALLFRFARLGFGYQTVLFSVTGTNSTIAAIAFAIIAIIEFAISILLQNRFKTFSKTDD